MDSTYSAEKVRNHPDPERSGKVSKFLRRIKGWFEAPSLYVGMKEFRVGHLPYENVDLGEMTTECANARQRDQYVVGGGNMLSSSSFVIGPDGAASVYSRQVTSLDINDPMGPILYSKTSGLQYEGVMTGKDQDQFVRKDLEFIAEGDRLVLTDSDGSQFYSRPVLEIRPPVNSVA